MSQSSDNPVATPVEARAATEPLVRRLGMVAILLGVGVWTILDYLNKGYQYGEGFNEHVRYCLNKFGIFVFAPIALVILVRAIVARSRRLVADEKGIGYAGKPQIAWNEITRVDATRLKGKGLLTIIHGQGRTWKLDEYDWRSFRDVVAMIDLHVPGDKIIR